MNARTLARPLALLAGLTLLAAFLRGLGLGEKSLWLDEAICFWASQAELEYIVYANRLVRATPPLFTFAIHFWSQLGDSETWLRLPAFAAGVAAVPASYALARHFVTTGAALFGALLLATSVRHIELSRLLSEYAPAHLAAVLLLLAYARFRERPDVTRTLTLVAAMGVAPGLHYGVGLLMVALGILFLIELPAAPDRGRRLAAGAVVALPLAATGLLAWFWLDVGAMLMGDGAPGGTGYLKLSYWSGTLPSLVRLSVGNTLAIFTSSHPLGSLVLLLAVLGVADHRRGAAERWIALALLTGLAVTFAAALVHAYPYDGKRHVFFLWPLLFLAASSGFARIQRLEPLPERRVLATTLVALVALSGSYAGWRSDRSEGKEAMRPVADRLAEERQPDDALFVYSAALPAANYYTSRGDPELRDELTWSVTDWLPPAALGVERGEIDSDRARLDAALAGAERVWILLSRCHRDECEQLLSHAARCAKIERVAARTSVRLLLAHPGPACRADGDGEVPR